MDKEIESEDNAYCADVVAREADDTKTWAIIKTSIFGLSVPVYFMCLFLSWDQTLRWTAFFWKLVALNAVVSFPLGVLLRLPAAGNVPAQMVRRLVVIMACVLVAAIAVLAVKAALHLEVVAHHKQPFAFFWWAAAFMVARSPYAVHHFSKLNAKMYGPLEAADQVSSKQGGRVFGLVTFFIFAFSTHATTALNSVTWIKYAADWIAR